jgi:ubiquinone/menaquinone biosynthesis C-methylase UbiE
LACVARFQNGSFTYTGLPDAPADAAVSLDALQYTPDIGAAFREVARLLRPGGRLAFTAFELDAVAVAGLPGVGTAPAEDFRPALEGAPLAIRVYKETQGWSERVYAAFSAVAGAQGVLREEMGPVAIAALMSEVTAVLERRIYKRGVYCLAQRV